MLIEDFLCLLFQEYQQRKREMPWRIPETDGSFDPYKILISEIMLQQTQVERTIPKYLAFVQRFPTIEKLARAPISDVLDIWLGLGYNRRAVYLHEIAKNLHGSSFPRNSAELASLKGIGDNTASAIVTYAFDQKEVFVETNIRTVMLDSFFPETDKVSDEVIKATLKDVLDVYHSSYREFYWAMMDYGAYLKKSGSKVHRKSLQYKIQSQFKGSTRELRGRILRFAKQHEDLNTARQAIADDRFDEVLMQLVAENLVEVRQSRIVFYGVHS